MKGEIQYREFEQWTADFEQQVLKDVSRGNHEAFRLLYLHYYDRLFQFAMIYLSSEAAAEDIVESVFFNILKNPEILATVSNFKSYVYKAVRNATINVLKSGYVARRDKYPIDWLEVDLICPDTPPGGEIAFRQLRTAVKNAVNALPERCRLVFKLVKEDRMSRQEVADALGVKLSTVAKQLMIAKGRIRRAIRPYID